MSTEKWHPLIICGCVVPMHISEWESMQDMVVGWKNAPSIYQRPDLGSKNPDWKT